MVASYPSIPYVGQYAGEDYGLFCESSSFQALQTSLTYPFLDTAQRKNRDLPIDAATQYFTLHLYSTKEMSRIGSNSANPYRRDNKPIPTLSVGAAAPAAVDDDDEDDDDDMPWGHFGNGRRPAPPEDSSLKKIKTVQGEEGRWTVTDCDADKKAEKCVAGGYSKDDAVQLLTTYRMIYSSITPYVHMLYTAEHDEEHICLDFSHSTRRNDAFGYDSFGVCPNRQDRTK